MKALLTILILSFTTTIFGKIITVQQVLKSALKKIPEIKAMEAQINKAKFQYLQALGNFDTKIKLGSSNEVFGGYPASDNKLLFDQPTSSGIRFFGGFRLGRGSFAVYDGKKKTNDFGELQGGILIPLVRNLGMNNPKFKLKKRSIGKLLSVALIRKQRILIQKIINKAYWNWYTAGKIFNLYRELLVLAEVRQKQIERRVELGDLPSLYTKDNKRTIFLRQEQVLSAKQLFLTASIYLSYFNRNSKNKMVTPNETNLPKSLSFQHKKFHFPKVLTQTMHFSPQLIALRLKKKEKILLKELAKNMQKPQLDLFLMGSKDFGGSDPKKEPWQLNLGVQFSLPIQNRKAKGMIGVAQSEISMIKQKKKSVKDKLRNIINRLLLKMRIEKKRYQVIAKELKMSKLVAKLERRSFFLGQSSLIFVNKRESDVTKTSIRLQKAKVNYLKIYHELLILQGQE